MFLLLLENMKICNGESIFWNNRHHHCRRLFFRKCNVDASFCLLFYVVLISAPIIVIAFKWGIISYTIENSKWQFSPGFEIFIMHFLPIMVYLWDALFLQIYLTLEYLIRIYLCYSHGCICSFCQIYKRAF